MSETQVREIGARWAEAEAAMDAAALAGLLHEDFRAVGPVGFVLTKEQWLRRYEGGLKIDSFAWQDVQVRLFGDTAITIGTQAQEATWQGNPSSGRFRVTHVFMKEGGAWRIASVHISPQQAP